MANTGTTVCHIPGNTPAGEVLEFWFELSVGTSPTVLGRRLWFQSDPVKQCALDDEIIRRFGPLLASAEQGALHNWMEQGALASLALVIVLDQFSRHVHRSGTPERLATATDAAVVVCEHVLEKESLYMSLTPAQLSFLLMPLRHQRPPCAARLSRVLKVAATAQQANVDSSTVLDRFIIATERRLEELGGAPADTINLAPAAQESTDTTVQMETDIQSIDGLEWPLEFTHLLEYDGINRLATDMNSVAYDTLYKSMQAFVHAQATVFLNSIDGKSESGAGSKDDDQSNWPILPLIVSLSGGVDSMVISHLLRVLQRRGLPLNLASDKIKRVHANKKQTKMNKANVAETEEVDTPERKRPKHNDKEMNADKAIDEVPKLPEIEDQIRQRLRVRLSVHAVHINYNNRGESADEARMVKEWCERLGIEWVEKNITSVRRGITARDEYEKISRQLRFNAYKELTSSLVKNSSASSLLSVSSLGVMFGHHRGDVQENVISNTMKGAGITELSGMKEQTLNDGVTIWRPLLKHGKDDILAYAHAYGVPYFLDTTPTWSTRGKLRNHLLPALSTTYGEGFVNHLSALAQQSDELAEVLETVLFAPFLNNVKYSHIGAVVPIAQSKDMPMFFWHHVMRQVCHKMGTSLIHEKALIQLLDRVKVLSAKSEKKALNEADAESWIQLKKLNLGLLLNGTDLLIFRENIFPLPENKKQFLLEREIGVHALTLQSHGGGAQCSLTLRSGPWSIEVAVVSAADALLVTLPGGAQGHSVDVIALCTSSLVEYVIRWPMTDAGEAVGTVNVGKCPIGGQPFKHWRRVARRLRDVLPIVSLSLPNEHQQMTKNKKDKRGLPFVNVGDTCVHVKLTMNATPRN